MTNISSKQAKDINTRMYAIGRRIALYTHPMHHIEVSSFNIREHTGEAYIRFRLYVVREQHTRHQAAYLPRFWVPCETVLKMSDEELFLHMFSKIEYEIRDRTKHYELIENERLEWHKF